MGSPPDARLAGERVEALLAQLRTDPRPADVAEDIVRCLIDLYGAGLARIAELVGPDTLRELADDPLVESLLLVHDLHPLDPDARVQRALDRVRPYLGSHAGGVRYLGIDADGVVRLELEGTCHGCPSSTVTVQHAIEQAVRDAVPEASGIHVAGVAAPAPLLQIGRPPQQFLECPVEVR